MGTWEKHIMRSLRRRAMLAGGLTSGSWAAGGFAVRGAAVAGACVGLAAPAIGQNRALRIGLVRPFPAPMPPWAKAMRMPAARHAYQGTRRQSRRPFRRDWSAWTTKSGSSHRANKCQSVVRGRERRDHVGRLVSCSGKSSIAPACRPFAVLIHGYRSPAPAMARGRR